MSANTAKLVGLSRKGAIQVGYDADFVVWDPEAEFVVSLDDVHFRHRDVCAYLGQRLAGRVLRTFLRGALVYRWDGAAEFVNPRRGSLIRSRN